MHIRGNTDDREHGAVAPLEALSYGVLTREILTTQRLADDGDRGRVATIIKSEVAARNKSDAHGMKVARSNEGILGHVIIIGCCMFEAKSNLTRITQRQMACFSYGCNSWKT